MPEVNIDLAETQVINFTVRRGDTWPDFSIKCKRNGVPVDLRTASVCMQVRTKPDDEEAAMELSTDNNAFLVTGTDFDTLTCNRPQVCLHPGKFMHDIEFIFDDGLIVTYYEGRVTAKPDITRRK